MAKSFWAEVFGGWQVALAEIGAVIFFLSCFGSALVGFAMGVSVSPWFFLLWLWLPLARVIYVAANRVARKRGW